MNLEFAVPAFDREVGVFPREEEIWNAFVDRHDGEEERIGGLTGTSWLVSTRQKIDTEMCIIVFPVELSSKGK